MVRSSSNGLASNAKAMPVSSGRVDDADPSTVTLRLGSRFLIETKAAPMRPCGLSSFREPSVSTMIPGNGYAFPAGPYAASLLYESEGSTPSAVSLIHDRRSVSSSRRCWLATAAALAQKVQPSAVFVAFVAPFRQLPLAAAARVPLRNTCTLKHSFTKPPLAERPSCFAHTARAPAPPCPIRVEGPDL